MCYVPHLIGIDIMLTQGQRVEHERSVKIWDSRVLSHHTTKNRQQQGPIKHHKIS